MARSRRANQEVLDALSDVITVSPTPDKSSFPASQNEYSSASYSGKAPMTAYEATPSVPTKDNFDPLGPGANRARNKETVVPPPPPPSKGNMSKIANAFRRHTPEEKEAKRREKERRMHKAIDDSTMKSSRMDIIDRLDLSGIHGSSLFHHDSPYDACSPHSNRNSRRAPVMAFDHTIDPMTGQPIGMRAQNPNNRPGLSPLAAATMKRMDDSAGDLDEGNKIDPYNANGQKSDRSRAMPNGQIPTLRMDSNFSTTSASLLTPSEDQVSADSHGPIDRDGDSERGYGGNNYYNVPSNVSKGRSDYANPNADIWGVTSEPWQDFAQPASTAGGLRPGNNARGGGQRMSGESGGSGNASAASSVFDMEAVMTGRKPVRQDSGNNNNTLGVERSEGPKRSKSLIKKIRTARQNPNVPPPQDDEVELGNLSISSDSAQRTNGSRGKYHHNHSPSTPPLLQNQQQSYTAATSGGLGRSGTLRAGSGNGYYQNQGEVTAPTNPGPTSPGLGRNNSIFGRFRGNGKNRERGEVTAR